MSSCCGHVTVLSNFHLVKYLESTKSYFFPLSLCTINYISLRVVPAFKTKIKKKKNPPSRNAQVCISQINFKTSALCDTKDNIINRKKKKLTQLNQRHSILLQSFPYKHTHKISEFAKSDYFSK